MNTYLLEWNIDHYSPSYIDKYNQLIASGQQGFIWTWRVFRPVMDLQQGDRCYLLQSGSGSNGIILFGTFTGIPYWFKPAYFCPPRPFADIKVECFSNINKPFIPVDKLKQILPETDWTSLPLGIKLSTLQITQFNSILQQHESIGRK